MKSTEFEENVLFPVGISLKSVISILPTATILIDLEGNIQYANVQALSFFLSPDEDSFYNRMNLNFMLIDTPCLTELVLQIKVTKASIDKISLIRRFDNSVINVNLFAQYFKSNFEGIILQFTHISAKANVFVTEKMKVIKKDIVLLKPYLNKPGKDLLEKIVCKNLTEITVDFKTTQKNYFNLFPQSTLNKLSQSYSGFSNLELSLCGLLSLKLSFEEISHITGKSSNSLRVLFHRLLKKTEFQNSKEFLRKLESL